MKIKELAHSELERNENLNICPVGNSDMDFCFCVKTSLEKLTIFSA